MGWIWVNTHDHTVHFPLDHDGTKARGRVAWEALQDPSGPDRLDQTMLLNAFIAQEGRIRSAALKKLEQGEDPLVGSKDL